jgi:predicted NAD/FAD-binding protein
VRVAIVGSGIAGLGCALLLQEQGHRVTLFEANDYLGGHTHTVDVTLDGVSAPVDTGFLVYNDRTYPRLVALFDRLGVRTAPAAMSFAMRDDAAGVEWSGRHAGALFAQPFNLVRPAFWRMLRDIERFNREARRMLRSGSVPKVLLGEYLAAAQYTQGFRDWYLLPMAASIWSSPKSAVLDFPLPSFIGFCDRHGLLQLADRPRWRSVVGGGHDYVRRIAKALSDVRLDTPVRRVRRRAQGVDIDAANGHGGTFDQVVLACHSDQPLALVTDPTPDEAALLGSIRYQANRVLLHTDARLMPKRKRAWSAWNYLGVADADATRPVAVSYWLNKLQAIPFDRPVFVTLNPPFDPAPGALIAEFDYAHPLVKAAAFTAQQQFAHLQGRRRTWYAGAWLGHGFHEDGLASAYVVADGFRTLAASAAATAELAA